MAHVGIKNECAVVPLFFSVPVGLLLPFSRDEKSLNHIKRVSLPE